MKIRCEAVFDRGEELKSFEYEPSPLAPHDVEIQITHCGICHSDIHLIDNDWSFSKYPLVPGHEIIGEVAALGDEVCGFEEGQRVGVGWQRSACLSCESCIAGRDNLCAESTATCVGHFGGFADRIRTDSRFVFHIPEALSSAGAAPLLCGGITVFSPLRNMRRIDQPRVGVLGIGGLGHLALQFAAALGCSVTAISSSSAKRDEALGFGARHFLALDDKSARRDAFGSLDMILSTAPGDLNWSSFLPLLRPRGTFCFLGVPQQAISLPALPLISGELAVSGSNIGSRSTMREMLRFAAEHRIEAKVEELPRTTINEAIARVRENSARYRMVIAN